MSNHPTNSAAYMVEQFRDYEVGDEVDVADPAGRFRTRATVEQVDGIHTTVRLHEFGGRGTIRFTKHVVIKPGGEHAGHLWINDTLGTYDPTLLPIKE